MTRWRCVLKKISERIYLFIYLYVDETIYERDTMSWTLKTKGFSTYKTKTQISVLSSRVSKENASLLAKFSLTRFDMETIKTKQWLDYQAITANETVKTV